MSCINQNHVNTEFIEGLPIEQVAAEISQLCNPHIIVWYIGCNGLRKSGADFYKNNLFVPVLNKNPESTFWLTDLTAWNAFKKPLSSIYKSSGCCEVIEQFCDNRLKCIRSSEIFKKMQEITDQDFIDYFRKALRRKFICQGSHNYPDKNISVGETFSNKCPTMVDWYDYDINKAYSIFQYFEGCLIVDEIFTRVAVDHSSDLHIIFALPNNESRYYKDDERSFQSDIGYVIRKRCNTLKLKKINVKIKFFTFPYGTHLDHRPYNATGKVIKSKKLSHNDIIMFQNKTTKLKT